MSPIEFRNLKNTIETELKKSSSVFITGHVGPDLDSIGSCIGLYTLAKNFKRKVYVIVDDPDVSLESGTKRIIDESKDSIKYITNKEFLELKTPKSLLIVTDVNKDYRISVGDYLDEFKSIIVIDHHEESDHVIPTDKRFIFLDASSASEIVGRLLSALKIKYSSDVANYLLAGICLDTNRFKKNTTSKTHDIAEKLIDNGGDIDYVNNLFYEPFDAYCRISNLIVNGTTIKKYSEDLLSPIQISFTLNRNHPELIYAKEDYAKAADKMLKFGVDAAFALGLVDEDIVHISARGGKRVNVGTIMNAMEGQCGGNALSAGGRIYTDDVFKVEDELLEKVSLGISAEEDIIEEPLIIKKKQLKKHPIK